MYKSWTQQQFTLRNNLVPESGVYRTHLIPSKDEYESLPMRSSSHFLVSDPSANKTVYVLVALLDVQHLAVMAHHWRESPYHPFSV